MVVLLGRVGLGVHIGKSCGFLWPEECAWEKVGENYGGAVLPGLAGRGASTVRILRIISNAVAGKVL